MSLDRAALLEALERGPVVRVVVTSSQGSAPREAGASMLVTAGGQDGTIGGGALEFQAVAAARDLLAREGAWLRTHRSIPLGPELQQCCGGRVSLLSERFGDDEADALAALTGHFSRPLDPGLPPVTEADGLAGARIRTALRSGTGPALTAGLFIERLEAPARPLWLYGAGHVGRAVVAATAGLPFDLVWVDDAPARFPAAIPPHARQLVAANPADAVRHAPDDAAHVVMTYSHALDLEICHRILARPFGFLGLIGSDTKAARFHRRLAALGQDSARLTCPIGDKRLGKTPQAIAIGLVHQLLLDSGPSHVHNRREHSHTGPA